MLLHSQLKKRRTTPSTASTSPSSLCTTLRLNYLLLRWTREGLFKFSFDLKTVSRAQTHLFNTKEACDHAFSYKTMNWGWAQFAKRDSVFYSAPAVKTVDSFLIVCTITSSPVTPTPPPTIARQYVPKSLMDSVGGMLDDPMYSDVEFLLPSRGRTKKGIVRKIYANKKILCRADYFDTSTSYYTDLIMRCSPSSMLQCSDLASRKDQVSGIYFWRLHVKCS